MNVLVGCECSQVVCSAFRERGHNASSKYPGSYNSAKLRSQTSPGIAKAMSLQWG